MMLGLRRGIVRLVPYDPRWARAYIREKQRIRAAMGKRAKGIEHFGSTAIPGVCAKPIMDIMVGIEKLRDFKACAFPLSRLGYVYRGISTPGERLFVRGPMSKRTHYLHMTRIGSRYWILHLRFREYMRKNKEAAGKYSELKKGLFKRFRTNRKRYTDGKSRFIRNILKLSRARR